MTVLRVKCSPDHARTLAYRMSVAGEFEVAAALQILADDVEGHTRALLAHHAINNLPESVWVKALGGECPICEKARQGHA